jgi:hypothetical protein
MSMRLAAVSHRPREKFAIDFLHAGLCTRASAERLATKSRIALRTPAGDPALAMFHAGSLPHFAATVAIEDVIEAVAP